MRAIVKYISTFMLGAITSLLIVLSSIGSGTLDWEYKLPNGYEMWRINSDEIVIKDIKNSTNDIEIPSFIKEFSYDEQYVLTRNVRDISYNNIFDEVYYVLDTKENKVYGPFDGIEELQDKFEEWCIQLPKKWYRTSPDPNMSR